MKAYLTMRNSTGSEFRDRLEFQKGCYNHNAQIKVISGVKTVSLR